MKRSTRLLLWLAALGILLATMATVAAVLILTFGGDFRATDPRPLAVTLEGEIPDAPQQGAFIIDETNFPPLVTELSRAIRQAADDPGVTGLQLRIRPLALGMASVQELTSALAWFRESGKSCVAHGEMLGNKEYLLAAACGEIHVAPAGMLLVNGISVTQTFYGNTMDMLDIKPNLLHVGDYKSAVEPYERTAPSEAAREATDHLLDSLWEQLVGAIAEHRDVTWEQAEGYLNSPPMDPDEALARGMVDGISYEEEVLDLHRNGATTRMGEYLKSIRKVSRRQPRVAVIHADGAIISGESGSGFMGGTFLGDRDFIKLVKEVEEDDRVVAVVVRVNSPGGSGLASDNMWRALRKLGASKPLVVSMGDTAASGGYYIASAAERIVAEPATLTGSIGVFGGKLNMRGLYNKLGLTLFSYKRGELADLLSPVDDFSEEGRERFGSYLESFYQVFLERVAEGRGMTTEEVHEIAQGRVWTGAQAAELGLVDAVGGLDHAVELARELAEVEEPTDIIRLPARKTFIQELIEDLTRPDNTEELILSRLPVDSRGLVLAEALHRALDDGGVAAMLPSVIHVD